MQSGSTIVAVVPGKDDVQVTYMQGTELKTAAAKAVIMATPKFITRRLVEGLPQKQNDAMQQMRYIPYSVVNLIFDKPVFNKGYDNWCPGNRFTDFIVADWVIQKQPGYHQKFNIASCYTPLKEEERSHLLNETGARKIAANVLSDFQKLMPEMNIQAPPNLFAPCYDELLDAGINDWGGVSPLTPDFINPEKPWPHLEQLKTRTESRGYILRQRLPVYPEFLTKLISRPGLLSDRVQAAADREGYATRLQAA